MCGHIKRQTVREEATEGGVEWEMQMGRKGFWCFSDVQALYLKWSRGWNHHRYHPHCQPPHFSSPLSSSSTLLVASLPSPSSPSLPFQTQTHSLHQVAESRTAAVSSALCCPHRAPSVSYNFLQQQTANNVALLSVCVHVCVSKSPFFFMNEDMCVWA